ncbi:hypothetical protein Y032_0726g1867 [Ancylostoma ceylanicum]|uniref:Uncharacterized protein n=1 Tax=Ancylostoma ceylanicum TaxID=53326 RepID=A0A016WF84_9BILA|nr:hypothetical protein Y032_0726g1867 [Ancylostoma ceylanicum]
MVLEAFRKANLRLKSQMCAFVKNSVSFLGDHDENGVRTDSKKGWEIVDYPALTNVGELVTFLEMASYYRKFIAGFSKITKGLYSLVSLKSTWK